MNKADKLRRRLGADAPDDDFTLDDLLTAAETSILTFCNISTIPPELESTVVDIAFDNFQSQKHTGVSSIHEGDMSVSFSDNSKDLSELYPHLKLFRKMRW